MRRAAPSVSPHARAAPTARAPRLAAANDIGEEGAKELAAALKANKTLTTLNVDGACHGAALPTPRHAHTRVQEVVVRCASPERTPHACSRQ